MRKLVLLLVFMMSVNTCRAEESIGKICEKLGQETGENYEIIGGEVYAKKAVYSRGDCLHPETERCQKWREERDVWEIVSLRFLDEKNQKSNVHGMTKAESVKVFQNHEPYFELQKSYSFCGKKIEYPYAENLKPEFRNMYDIEMSTIRLLHVAD